MQIETPPVLPAEIFITYTRQFGGNKKGQIKIKKSGDFMVTDPGKSGTVVKIKLSDFKKKVGCYSASGIQVCKENKRVSAGIQKKMGGGYEFLGEYKFSK